MTDYIKKVLEDLTVMNEERKQSIEKIDIDELVDEIFAEKEKVSERIYAHIFICMDEKTANEVNVFPAKYAKVINNLVIIRKVDELHETKNSMSIKIDNTAYAVPMKYSYSFSFVK
jgi:hypothetical protein